jgi:hypothetical protein
MPRGCTSNEQCCALAGETCSTVAECCNFGGYPQCNGQGRCCVRRGGPCTGAAECCSGICSGTQCAATPDGSSCVDALECASFPYADCANGVCCRLQGQACSANTECCGGTCRMNGTCN